MQSFPVVVLLDIEVMDTEVLRLLIELISQLLSCRVLTRNNQLDLHQLRHGDPLFYRITTHMERFLPLSMQPLDKPIADIRLCHTQELDFLFEVVYIDLRGGHIEELLVAGFD